MKEVMWKLGDEEGTFDYSATSQKTLFSSTPTVEQLIEYLKKNFVGTDEFMDFLQLRIKTYQLPFLEKHYRKALKQLESDGLVEIERKASKRNGIKEGDFINFR